MSRAPSPSSGFWAWAGNRASSDRETTPSERAIRPASSTRENITATFPEVRSCKEKQPGEVGADFPPGSIRLRLAANPAGCQLPAGRAHVSLETTLPRVPVLALFPAFISASVALLAQGPLFGRGQEGERGELLGGPQPAA